MVGIRTTASSGGTRASAPRGGGGRCRSTTPGLVLLGGSVDAQKRRRRGRGRDDEKSLKLSHHISNLKVVEVGYEKNCESYIGILHMFTWDNQPMVFKKSPWAVAQEAWALASSIVPLLRQPTGPLATKRLGSIPVSSDS